MFVLPTRLILIGLALSSVALAQEVRPLGSVHMRTPGVSPPVALLAQKPVQQELKISADQLKRITPLLTDDRDAMSKAYERVHTVLSAPQIERLEQIHRQVLGARALAYKPYGNAIGVTKEQLEQIEAAQSKLLMKAIGAPPSPSKDGKVTRISVDTKKLTPQLNAEAKKILTPSQWRKWQSMQGKPFGTRK